MRGAVLVVALCGCGFTPHATTDATAGDDAADAPRDSPGPTGWLTGYHFRKSITVTTAAALVDFPLGLVRVKDHDLAAHASGDDLVVTGADGVTPLDRELVTSLVDGTIELWVRATLAPGAQTFYLYYGGVSGADSRAMWSGMTGVWHLSDPMMMPSADSSPHAHALTSTGPMQMPMSKPGVSGNARNYDGLDDSIGIGDPGDGSLDVGTTSFSFTLWVKSTPVGAFDTALWKGGTSTAEPGYCLITGNQFWNVKIHDGTTYVDPLVGTAAQLQNQWVHVAGVVDRTASTFTAFANGAPTQALSITGLGSLDNNLAFDLGRPSTGVFKGLVDEVRIYPRALAPEWIAAEYANLANPSFAVFGSEQMH